MTKRTGFFLLGTVAALAALVLVLGLAGSPDKLPTPQYTAEDVEAHYLKQLEAARQAKLEQEAQAAREAQARAEAEASRLAEEQRKAVAEAERQAQLRLAAEAEAEAAREVEAERQAEAALAAERARQAELELQTKEAGESSADAGSDEAEETVVAQVPIAEETPSVPEVAALSGSDGDSDGPTATEALPSATEPQAPAVAEEVPNVTEAELLRVAETPVASETPVAAEAPSVDAPIVAEVPAIIDETPVVAEAPAPTPTPLEPEVKAEPEPEPEPVLTSPEPATGGPKVVAAKPSTTTAPKKTANVDSEFPKTGTRGVTVSGTATRPQFPWPPPQASTVVRLPLSRFEDALTRGTHGEIADLLESALDQGEYFDRSYWVAPGGFALATRLERITEDGVPVDVDERWPTSNLKERFDLSKYLRALFYTDPGYFRVIVFVLSTEFERTSDEEPTPKEAFRWLRRGMVMLPRDMAEQAVTARHELTALIYEFEREAGSNAVVLAPGRLSGRTHLARARLQRLLAPE